MITLDLNEAAALLKIHPQTVLERARSGNIPAAKPGKCWVFIEEDLLEWLRSKYTSIRQDVGQGGKTCSLKEKITPIGITNSLLREKQYTDLLEPTTKKRRNK
jgi:excisionase family DNA binding protein